MREFFQNKLGYWVIEKLNCTRQQMFDAIEEAKQEVREKNANRLIVTILTHGEEVRKPICAADWTVHACYFAGTHETQRSIKMV